jgi:hypothetical protein
MNLQTAYDLATAPDDGLAGIAAEMLYAKRASGKKIVHASAQPEKRRRPPQ